MMKDASLWSVRDLKRYLRENGINTRGYKQKGDLIEIATALLYENEQAEWIKNVTTLAVICVTVLLLNVYMRHRIEKIFWLNPKWLLSWIVLHALMLLEKLLLINVILSWILPSTLREYNLIERYLVKQWQLFPLTVPLNYDSQTQSASMWIDLYPMLMLFVLRKCKTYLTMHHHYMWYDKYRAPYYHQIRQQQLQQDEADGQQQNNAIAQETQSDSDGDDASEEYEEHNLAQQGEHDDAFNEQLQQALFASMQNTD